MKGCVISAPMTGSGKTTVTLGLLAALRAKGIAVQPFKVGPDFIDPGLHAIAAGVASHNLDGWMLSREVNEELFNTETMNKGVAVVEGVMGLFDGFDGATDVGSTAEMAKWLGLPVVVVIDVSTMARSAAAIVHGVRTFDPAVSIAGVIFNRVGGPGHFRILQEAVQDVPILGWLPADASIEIPERHLGLRTAKEELVAERIERIGKFFQQHIDAEKLLETLPEIAPSPLPLFNSSRSALPTARDRLPTGEGVRVAIAQDAAFSFYYAANRVALERAGARIIEFSPLKDAVMPEADFLYIGGGYPELYRRDLESNESMRESVRQFIETGKRFYAECGGLMYLSRSIEGSRMVGILDLEIEMTSKPVNFGYCAIRTSMPSIFGPTGTIARGHQFHHSRIKGDEAWGSAYNVQQGPNQYTEGFVLKNGLASYIHLHFLSNPDIARNMLHS